MWMFFPLDLIQNQDVLPLTHVSSMTANPFYDYADFQYNKLASILTQ